MENYVTYDETDADYLIFVEESQKRIKIVKKDSKEILATFLIFINKNETEEQRAYTFIKTIHDSLETLGFKVKELPKPPVYESTNYK